jgi:hypothetical protein
MQLTAFQAATLILALAAYLATVRFTTINRMSDLREKQRATRIGDPATLGERQAHWDWLDARIRARRAMLQWLTPADVAIVLAAVVLIWTFVSAALSGDPAPPGTAAAPGAGVYLGAFAVAWLLLLHVVQWYQSWLGKPSSDDPPRP